MYKLQCQKLGKIFISWTYKLLFSFTVISNVYRSPEALKVLSKAVTVKFHGSGSHSKCNSLQDWANFHRSLAWQIALIFNTENVTGLVHYFFQLWHGFFQKIFIMNIWNVCDICARKLGHSDCFQYGLCFSSSVLWESIKYLLFVILWM